VAAQVFISYSSKDSKVARTICSALESRGLVCWIASRDVGPGESFMAAIVRAIRGAKVMVLVFSENANNSEEIKREIVLAGNYKVTVIPVRVEDVVPGDEFAYQFATRQWIDLFEDWEQQIERLSKWIAGLSPPDTTTSEAKPEAAAGPPPPAPKVAAQDQEHQQQAEAEQRAAEEAQRIKDEAEAQRAAEEQRRREAQARQRADADRAFMAAERVDTVSALDAFLAAHPQSHRRAEAEARRAALATRDEAYRGLTNSTDAAALKNFLVRYPEGKLSDDVRAWLCRLEPALPQAPTPPRRHPSRRAVIVGGTAGLGALGIAAIVASNNAPSPEPSPQPEPSPSPQPQSSPPLVPVSPPQSQNPLIRTFTGHTYLVSSVAFSPDGRTGYSGGDLLRCWDLASGRQLNSFNPKSTVLSIAITRDGRNVLTGVDVTRPDHATLILIDLNSGDEIRAFRGQNGAVNAVALTPDSTVALGGGWDKTVGVWRVSDGALLATLEGLSVTVNAIAVAPDAASALITAGSASWERSGNQPNDTTFKLYDIGPGDRSDRLIRTFAGHTDAVLTVAFTPDGRNALSGSADRTLKLWDLSTGSEIRTFTGHSDAVFSVAIAPDGRTALSGSRDSTLKLWDLGFGNLLRTFTGHAKSVTSVAIAPDGRTALSGSFDNTVKLWDLT
jgi:hypothetical protein